VTKLQPCLENADSCTRPNYTDLRGLPPLLIHVGSDEVLLDDAIILDAHARAAGVQSRLEVWGGMVHVWLPSTPCCQKANRVLHGLENFCASSGQWPDPQVLQQ
jgi:acetyl esterase/lipase